jgi:hypothetical protein
MAPFLSVIPPPNNVESAEDDAEAAPAEDLQHLVAPQAAEGVGSAGRFQIATPKSSAAERIPARRAVWQTGDYHDPQSTLAPRELAMDTVTTTATPILALDLGKYKSGAGASAGDPAARFESLPTGRTRLRRLFAKHRPAVVPEA